MALSLIRKVASIFQAGEYDPTVFKAPTITVLTSGSGTYMTPSGCRYLKIKMVGGGGGGGGGSTTSALNNNSSGAGGTATTFGASLLIGNFGAGGVGGGATSLETREKLRAANTGKKHSAETRKKLSLSNKGKSSSLKGRKLTDEQKREISLKQTHSSILCQTTNEVFECFYDLRKKYKVCKSQLANHIKGRKSFLTVKGMTFTKIPNPSLGVFK